MSQAGARAGRRTAAERELATIVREHGAAAAQEMARVFQPVYEKVCRERDVALERAAVLQTAIELIATGLPHFDGSNAEYAQQILDQLGITPDIQVSDGG